MRRSERERKKCGYLAELEGVLFAGELEVAADEDDHAACRAGGLAIYGGDAVLALLEGEASELRDDVLRPLDLLALEGQHRLVLVQAAQARSIRIERRVVVLYECSRQLVWIHLRRTRSLPSPPQ